MKINFAVLLGLWAVFPNISAAQPAAAPEATASFSLTSAAFKEGDEISPQYACDGANASPALRWTGAPSGVKSFAIILKDPDAPGGTFFHWVIFNIPATKHGLPKSFAFREKLPDGTIQGLNDFGKVGYGGPCPPSRNAHRYIFTLYALDAKLPARVGMKAGDLGTAMKGHILAQTRLMGTYRRNF